MPVDANGSSVNASQPLVFALAGANLVSNSALTHDANGWASWNATAPSGQLVRDACPPGTCLRYAAGGSQGVVASPAFAVQQGQWYRLTVDLATGQDNQPVQIVLRRAGGNYEALSNKSLEVTAGRAWARYSMLFQAAKTANSREAGTGDTGARIDFDAIRTGQSLSLANLELVPVNVDAAGTVSTALVNAGAAATAVGCPFSATQPALCGKLVKLADDQPVTWPLRLAPRTATILYGQEPPLPDADRDGIPDAQDLCPGTPPGTAVNAAGCGIQLR